MRRFADYFFGRVAGHLREGRADVNNMRAWRVELRRHNDDRFITLLNRRFEQPQLRFGLIVKSSLLACDDRAPRAGAGPGDLPRFLALLAPGVLTPRGGEVGFKHAILLNQLTLTRHVPPPPFGLFDGLAHGAAQFRSFGAVLFEAIMRAALHRLDSESRVVRIDQYDNGASRRSLFGGKFLERVQYMQVW